MNIKKKSPNRYLWRSLVILFVVFIALYIAMESGYYTSNLGRKVELTQEQILQFEQDIKDGKEIDIKDYLKDDYKDYGNKISKAGMNISNGTEKFMTKGISSVFKVIKTLFS